MLNIGSSAGLLTYSLPRTYTFGFTLMPAGPSAMIICGMPFFASNGVVSPAAPGILFEAMPITLDFPLLILAEPTQSTAAS